MKFRNLITILLILVWANSCADNSKYSAEQILAEAPHELVLDGEEKWVVDEEMMVSIKSMENSIHDFDGAETSEFHQLAKTIKSNLSSLTSSCTMTGQSHDELHKWLLPFFDLNFELMEVNNSEEGRILVESLEYELFVFNLYFK